MIPSTNYVLSLDQLVLSILNMMLILILRVTGTMFHSSMKIFVNNFMEWILLTLFILRSPLSKWFESPESATGVSAIMILPLFPLATEVSSINVTGEFLEVKITTIYWIQDVDHSRQTSNEIVRLVQAPLEGKKSVWLQSCFKKDMFYSGCHKEVPHYPQS